MTKSELKREEIENIYKWDLTPIFKDIKEFDDYYNKVKNEIKDVQKWQGQIVLNGKNLYNYLKSSDEIERKIYKIYYYAHLNYDSDSTNTLYQELENKATILLNEYEKISSFVSPELMTIDYDKIKEFYLEEPKLLEYEFILENLYRFKPHILSKEEEHILSIMSKTFDNPEKTFESLTDTDMTFGTILDENKKEVTLTESNYAIYIASKDRNVRKRTFELLFKTYSNFKNTIANTFKGNVDVLTSISQIKKYNNSIEAALFQDNVPVSVYQNLIDTVHQNMDKIYNYYQLKKEVLNLDELHSYDIYAELVQDLDKNYSFDEAKKLVIEALSVLGNDYVTNLNKAFDEKWIDIYPNKGKRGGAYSSGFYDTKPYVLLNFEGKFHDVSTLAHELGHSMHTYYSCKNNPYQYSSYKIFVAEVASTVNEILLNKYMYNKATDKNEKLFLLNQLLELFKSTIYRQTMFAEFEMNIHKRMENGEVLTEKMISDYYYSLNELYFGKDVHLDDLIRYEWERIPHFYYDFYVYKYALGLSAACYIVDGILNNKENALENYLNFLKSGGKDYPMEELKIAGVDISKKEVIESALNMFEATIEEFKKQYK